MSYDGLVGKESNRIKHQRTLMGICPTDGVQQGIMGLVWPRFCRAGVRGVVFELPLDSTLSNQQS